jgi:hypothetical protein
MMLDKGEARYRRRPRFRERQENGQKDVDRVRAAEN